MGQVYLAEQLSLKRNVAIKIMRPDLEMSSAGYKRFRAEAEAIARVNHANIVQVYAFGEAGGIHYMALEYVDGRSLADYQTKKGPPELPVALSIMRQVGAALQRASELGIVHRDIKPENILMTRRGEVKVADFGLSRYLADDNPALKLTQPGMTLGTPLYMSPEQVQGRAVDSRTDIYSFGATCYHMLAGHPPFQGCTAYEVALQHVQAEPRPLGEVRPDVPVPLCAIIYKMMAKDPNERYQTCSELLKDLSRLRDHLGVARFKASGGAITPEMGTTGGTGETPAIRRRFKWPALVAATLLISLCSGGALAWLHGKPRAIPLADPSRMAQTTPPRMMELQKEEEFLNTAIDQDLEPGSDRLRLTRGVSNRIDLSQFYLRENRLDDAERFFIELMGSRVRAYHTLGKIGHAIVLAYQNKTTESNREFLGLIGGNPGEGEHAERMQLLMNQPRLRAEIARALTFNKANATAAEGFPLRLESWRVPPRWQAKGRSEGQGAREEGAGLKSQK
jgi:serine/threonine-protein kinase